MPLTLPDCPVMKIVGANAFPTHTHVRAGCRGLVFRGDEILLSHEWNSGWYLIPGGGLEGDETPEACCIREVEEETGAVVEILRPVLTLHEYYEDWLFVSHYFLCRYAGEGRQSLTAAEERRGLKPEWMKTDEALALFARHQDYAATSEEKRGSYQREYTALSYYFSKEKQP